MNALFPVIAKFYLFCCSLIEKKKYTLKIRLVVLLQNRGLIKYNISTTRVYTDEVMCAVCFLGYLQSKCSVYLINWNSIFQYKAWSRVEHTYPVERGISLNLINKEQEELYMEAKLLHGTGIPVSLCVKHRTIYEIFCF